MLVFGYVVCYCDFVVVLVVWLMFDVLFDSVEIIDIVLFVDYVIVLLCYVGVLCIIWIILLIYVEGMFDDDLVIKVSYYG